MNYKSPIQDNGFGVYIHWPFCTAKCPYCDFNSHVRPGEVNQKRYVAALTSELEFLSNVIGKREVTSIFFGGGTPSLMTDKSVESSLDTVSGLWSLAEDVEITIEANPVSVETDRFRGYKMAGVNRVSLGVQAFNNEDLKKLGRIHDLDDALSAINTSARVFNRTSFDLIYARPQQKASDWRAELRKALSLAGEHLSLYQLTIEEGTRFFQQQQSGDLVIPDDDEARALYDITQEECEQSGLPAYEISNHAKPGGESRHNLLYWRYGEYVGVGAGAHGRLVTSKGRIATRMERNPEKWMNHVEKKGHGIVEQEELMPSTEAEEFLMMGMRLKEGILVDRFSSFSGQMLNQKKIIELMEIGMLHSPKEGRIAATPQSVFVLNRLISELLS